MMLKMERNRRKRVSGKVYKKVIRKPVTHRNEAQRGAGGGDSDNKAERILPHLSSARQFGPCCHFSLLGIWILE